MFTIYVDCYIFMTSVQEHKLYATNYNSDTCSCDLNSSISPGMQSYEVMTVIQCLYTVIHYQINKC